MFLSGESLENLVLAPIIYSDMYSNNDVNNTVNNRELSSNLHLPSFSETLKNYSSNNEKTSNSLFKGFTLNNYKNQGEILRHDGTNYFLERDSLIERIVLKNLRRVFEDKWNNGFSTTDSDFMTSRKKFYENANISKLPVFKPVRGLHEDNVMFFEVNSSIVNMAKYLNEEKEESKKVKAISSLFKSLRIMHKHDYVVGDPSVFIVQYSEGRAYFTNLRFARKTNNYEDFARDASQFIISGSYNSKLPIKDVFACFSNNYDVSDDFVNGLKRVVYDDSKPAKHFSYLTRNVFSKFIFGKSFDKVKKERKEILDLVLE